MRGGVARGILCGEDRDLDMVIQDLVVYSERESRGSPRKEIRFAFSGDFSR